MINVVDQGLQRYLGHRLSLHPSRLQHPGIEHGANDGVAPDQFVQLLIGELPFVRNK